MKYSNPVIPGFHPDPSICRVGQDFYLVTSSFEYFPGVPIFHSRNLVNWKQIGHCLTRDSQLRLSGARISGGIYAPTLRYRGGRYYMVTTNTSNGGNFFVWSDDPAGEWSEPLWVEDGGIDPDLFWDDDGSVFFTRSGIHQRKIEIETGRLLTKSVGLWSGCAGHYPEAPHIYKINGRYYLMIAEGGTEYGHCVTIVRGPGPQGPWESCPHNPILTHRSKMTIPIQATGHADMIEDQNGNWWMVCLGIRPKGFHLCHFLGRETFLTPVKWVDGWPVVGTNGEIALEMEGPDGLPPVENQSYATRDDFTEDQLSLHWNFLCNPVKGNWSLADSQLNLACVGPDLNAMEGQSWVGRRQQHFNFRVSARIEFTAQKGCEEAGLTVFQNINHHYEVGATARDGEGRLIVRRTIGTLSVEVASIPVPEGPLVLVIEGNEADYRLGYAVGDSAPVFLAKGETRYLSTEVGGRFTGVYLAMYATGRGHSSDNTAKFDWFEYKVLDEQA